MWGYLIRIALNKPFIFSDVPMRGNIIQVILQLIQVVILVTDFGDDGGPQVLEVTDPGAVSVDSVAGVLEPAVSRLEIVVRWPE
jgi:hypothetical protein